jgi:hypothetical protein
MNNRQRLIDIIFEHNLDRLSVGELLKVKHDTVNKWLLSNESKSNVEIPDMAIELLEYKFGIVPVEDAPSEPGL